MRHLLKRFTRPADGPFMPTEIIVIRVALARRFAAAAFDQRLPACDRAAYLRAAWNLLRDVATE